MTGANTELSVTQLCLQLAQQQTIVARVRSWLYVLRRRGWHRSVAEWPRWLRLARHASPRYWLYAATCELCLWQADVLKGCNGPDLNPVALGILREYLPMLPPDASAELRDGKEIASAIAWNYHQFLEETRG